MLFFWGVFVLRRYLLGTRSWQILKKEIRLGFRCQITVIGTYLIIMYANALVAVSEALREKVKSVQLDQLILKCLVGLLRGGKKITDLYLCSSFTTPLQLFQSPASFPGPHGTLNRPSGN